MSLVEVHRELFMVRNGTKNTRAKKVEKYVQQQLDEAHKTIADLEQHLQTACTTGPPPTEVERLKEELATLVTTLAKA